MGSDHSHFGVVAVLPEVVEDVICVEEGVIHVVGRRVHGEFGGSQIRLVQGTHFDFCKVVEAAVDYRDPGRPDCDCCDIVLGVVGPLWCSIVPYLGSTATELAEDHIRNQTK